MHVRMEGDIVKSERNDAASHSKFDKGTYCAFIIVLQR